MSPFLTCSPLPHPLHRNAIRSPHRQSHRRWIWAIYAALKPSGRKFLDYLMKFSASEEYRTGRVAYKELKLSFDLTKMAKITDEKRAVVVIMSTTVQKAMLAAGLASKEETKACLEAVSNLSADFLTAAMLGPETAGIGA